jgi:hypothetical protein
MHATKILSTVALTLAMGGTALAQTASDTLVGITNNTQSTGAATVDMQVPSFGNCSAATQVGAVGSNSGSLFAGGSAYDPRHQAVWVTDGTRIVLYRLSDKKTLCTFKPTRQISTPAVGVPCGLAISPSRGELYQLETITNQMALTVYDVSQISPNCNPAVKKAGCTVKIGAVGETAGGLAYDEARDLFYYVTSWMGFARPGFFIYAAHRSNPCKLYAIGFSPCSDKIPITGAAYSHCQQFLYIAMGSEVNVVRMADPLNGNVVNMNQLLKVPCCQKQTGNMWAGLAVMPKWGKRSVGQSCVATNCGPCSSMKLDLSGGDMVLGNPDVALDISGAPTGGAGAFYISLGTCTGGVGLPGLCGQVYPSLGGGFPVLLGIFPLTGQSGACSGGLHLKLGGVPTDAALCTVSACSQFLIRCPQGGTGLTNAVEFTIGG